MIGKVPLMEKGKIQAIESAALNAWAAPRQMYYDGRLLRMTGGDSKRVNSVNVCRMSTLPFDEKIRKCEQIYAQHKQPLIFRLPEPFTSSELRQALINKGYQEFDPTFVLGREISAGKDLPDNVSVRILTAEDWLQVRSWLTGTPLVELVYHAAVLNVILPEKVLVGLYVDDIPAACGMGVVEGNLLGYFSIYTHSGMRRQGYGSVVMEVLSGWGKEKGATYGYLQVEGDNATALRMYEKLGFMRVYRYSYWKK